MQRDAAGNPIASGILRHASGQILHVWRPGLAIPEGVAGVLIRPRRGRGYWRPLTPRELSAENPEDAAREAIRDYLAQHRLPGRHDGWTVSADGYRTCQWYFTVGADQ